MTERTARPVERTLWLRHRSDRYRRARCARLRGAGPREHAGRRTDRVRAGVLLQGAVCSPPTLRPRRLCRRRPACAMAARRQPGKSHPTDAEGDALVLGCSLARVSGSQAPWSARSTSGLERVALEVERLELAVLARADDESATAGIFAHRLRPDRRAILCRGGRSRPFRRLERYFPARRLGPRRHGLEHQPNKRRGDGRICFVAASDVIPRPHVETTISCRRTTSWW